MNIVLNSSIYTPLYQQIAEQIKTQILNGSLPPDFCLPSIRSIAKELRISVITVKNAYELLEKSGYIYTLAGKGCFVARFDNKHKKDEIISAKAQEITEFCAKYEIPIEELIKKCS